jgi:hypothetical protein
MLNQTYNEIIKFNEYVSEFKEKNYTLENAKLIANEFFNKYDVDFMLIVGTTPSFNDGEPCEHYSDAYTNDEIFDYRDLNDLHDGEEYEDHNYLFHVEKFSGDENIAYNTNINNIPWNDLDENQVKRKEIRTVKQILCDILDSEYSTNYTVFISRDKDGFIQFEHEDYYDY